MQAVLKALGLILGPLLLSVPAGASTIVASPIQGGLEDAILASSPGDTILVSPGVYPREDGGSINHRLTIIGFGGAEMNEIRTCWDLCQGFALGVMPGVHDVVIRGLTFTK